MKKLVYLVASAVLVTSMLYAQSTGAGKQTALVSGNSSMQQSDRTGNGQSATNPNAATGSAQTVPNPTSPSTALPNATIHDRPSGTSTTNTTGVNGQGNQPSPSTMGSTGSTPADQNSTNSETPQENTSHSDNTPAGQQPNSTASPSSAPQTNPQPNGTNNPHASTNGSSQSDMSGTSPQVAMGARPAQDAGSPMARARATHTPDPGTQAAIDTGEVASDEQAGQNMPGENGNANGLPQTSSLLPLLGLTGMGSLVTGLLLRRPK